MAKSTKNDKGLADPSRLAPTDRKDDETVQVVSGIEQQEVQGDRRERAGRSLAAD
jgi:hypothetical protein